MSQNRDSFVCVPSFFIMALVPVSYTHLDVYKRQGAEMAMPGDNVNMKVKLITPIAIEEGLRFAIREGGRTVGSGVVSKINE